MTDHTKEPWPEPVSEDWGGWDKASHPSLGLLGLDDYRRARACVNACAGFSDSELSEVADHGGFVDQTRYNAKVTAQRDELNRLCQFNQKTMEELVMQRDQLLAALKEAVDELRDMKKNIGFRAHTLTVIAKADDAIAEVEGSNHG